MPRTPSSPRPRLSALQPPSSSLLRPCPRAHQADHILHARIASGVPPSVRRVSLLGGHTWHRRCCMRHSIVVMSALHLVEHAVLLTRNPRDGRQAPPSQELRTLGVVVLALQVQLRTRGTRVHARGSSWRC